MRVTVAASDNTYSVKLPDGQFHAQDLHRLLKPCEECGGPIQPSPNRHYVRRFCSPSCVGKAGYRTGLHLRRQDGEHNPNFKGWASKRKLVYVNRYRAKHPDAVAAYRIYKNALRRGELVRATACDSCGAPPKRRALDGHHDDYSKPLQVRYLCRRCHRRLDWTGRAA